MGNVRALLLLLILPVLLSSSSSLPLNEARPLRSSTTKENMATALRKGSGRGGGGGARGDSNGSSLGAVLPKSGKPKLKHNSAHSGCSFSISALLIISAFWLESLACLYSFSY